MPGSSTTPGRSDLAMVRPKRVAFRARNGVSTRGLAFAAQWLAYALPYRRFVAVLADANARLGADVDRYSFIVVDLHHLLLAGLPAHFESDMPSHAVGLCRCAPCASVSTVRGPLPGSEDVTAVTNLLFDPSFFGRPLKCEVAHTSPPMAAVGRVSEPGGEHGTETKTTQIVFAVGMASIILAVVTWAMAQPSLSPMYRPQLLLLY
jgi:hypothetical protein